MGRWLLALLLLVPAVSLGAGRDFSQESECQGAWILGSDDTMSGADGVLVDKSTVGRDFASSGHVVADVDVAPPLAPAGRDSAIDNGAQPFILASAWSGYAGPSISVGGWARHDVAVADTISQSAAGTPAEDSFFLFTDTSICNVALNSATTSGPACPTDSTWFFLMLVHGDTGDENVLLTSESTVARTLRDCGAGCAANSTQGTGIARGFFLFTANAGGNRWDGNLAEFSIFNTELADADACELCRCGTLAGVRGIGRWSECNACETPPRHRCRRRS